MPETSTPELAEAGPAVEGDGSVEWDGAIRRLLTQIDDDAAAIQQRMG